MENSVDTDQMPWNTAPDLGLHCLLRYNYPNNYSEYSADFKYRPTF